MSHLLGPVARRSASRLASTFVVAAAPIVGTAFLPVVAQVSYSITDGAADLTLSIDPGEAIVFLNTFPADLQGQHIDQIKVAYGRVGGPSPLNLKPVKILLYEDQNGGSPQDATLLWTFDTTIANGNTNTLNVYSVPLIRVATTLVVGFYYRNTTASAIFIGALDTTAPTLLERSYAGFATTIDPAHLENIPAGQWGSQESFGTPGNFRVEARGQATDGIALTIEGRPELGVVRLNWTGTKPSYVLERASTPDFADAQTLATGTLTTYDDPVFADGATWYYRVR